MYIFSMKLNLVLCTLVLVVRVPFCRRRPLLLTTSLFVGVLLNLICDYLV